MQPAKTAHASSDVHLMNRCPLRCPTHAVTVVVRVTVTMAAATGRGRHGHGPPNRDLSVPRRLRPKLNEPRQPLAWKVRHAQVRRRLPRKKPSWRRPRFYLICGRRAEDFDRCFYRREHPLCTDIRTMRGQTTGERDGGKSESKYIAARCPRCAVLNY